MGVDCARMGVPSGSDQYERDQVLGGMAAAGWREGGGEAALGDGAPTDTGAGLGSEPGGAGGEAVADCMYGGFGRASLPAGRYLFAPAGEEASPLPLDEALPRHCLDTS